MNLLFYASGELKLSDECIFGLASWQHHTSVTCACVPVCLCACVPPPVHCSPFLGRTSHLTATPCFLSAKMQNCEQTLQVEIYNTNHTWSVLSKENMVNCQIIKAGMDAPPRGEPSPRGGGVRRPVPHCGKGGVPRPAP